MKHPQIPHHCAPLTRWIFALFLALFLCGCDTICFNQRMLVKMKMRLPDNANDIASHYSTVDGWTFRHVAQAPLPRPGQPDISGEWYVAYQVSGTNAFGPVPVEEKHSLSLFQLFGLRWRTVHRVTPDVAEAANEVFHRYPLLLEPAYVFYRGSNILPNSAPESTGTAPADVELPPKEVRIGNPPMAMWPVGTQESGGKKVDNPIWWKDPAHTELSAALDAVRERLGGRRSAVKIGLIDTGFNDWHVGVPRYLYDADKQQGDADGWVRGLQTHDLVGPGWVNYNRNTGLETHAMGTVGLLAGTHIIFSSTNQKAVPLAGDKNAVYLGGAPDSAVLPVRIAPEPVSLSTGAMAYAIDYASRVEHCDVLSISQGGSPMLAWSDAINAAYERGTAIFAAESDWYRFPIPPEIHNTGLGFPLPGPFYPAAFRRVIGVTGATANDGDYANNHWINWLANLKNGFQWCLRGSYGPDGWSGLWGWRMKGDPIQEKYSKFRSWPIAAYGPNTIWLSGSNRADFDGSGDSAATPQVAAAAALWLDYNRDKIPSTEWGKWYKAEAVYQALLNSAALHGQQKPDYYMGNGVLKAADALKWTYSEIRPGLRQPIDRDDYDARKSFRWLAIGESYNRPDLDKEIAQLDQNTQPTGMTQLQRYYYNTLLLEKWHRGVLPFKNHQQDKLEQAAVRLAAEHPARVKASSEAFAQRKPGT